jgi:PhnB protein
MSSERVRHIRHGRGAVRPYLFGYPDLEDLLVKAFGASIVEKLASAGGHHIECVIGDSTLVLEVADSPHASGTPASIYVYVPDVDDAFARAVACGASVVEEPVDKPYEERSAGVRDRYGNTWWVSTYTGPEVPSG